MLQNIPKITYVIAYQHKADRLHNLKRVLEWLTPFQGLNVVIVEQDKKSRISELNLRAKHIFLKTDLPFNKAWAFNVALRYCDTPIIIYGDSDLVMHPQAFLQAVQTLDFYDCVNPYNSVIDLTTQEGMMDLNSILQINRIGRGEAADDIQKVPMMGGIFMMKKEAFYKIGGHNEDFIGWGAEDNYLDVMVKNFLTHTTLPNKCYHFYHEKSKIDMKLYQRNMEILNHFSNASKQQLQNHINLVLPKIGRLNKYS